MFQQNSTEASSSDPVADASPNQSLHKKDDDPSKTVATDPNTPQPTPPENAPLPLKLSFNLFAPRSEPPKSAMPKGEGEERKPDPKQNGSAIPLVTPLPGLIQPPVLPVAAKAGMAVDPNDASARQDNPRIDADEKPSSSQPAPQLAFALRLTPNGEQQSTAEAVGHTRAVEPPANAPVNGVQSTQGQRDSAGSNSDAANHHSSNQQSDSGLAAADALPSAPSAVSGASYQVVHAAAADVSATPAPAAPPPAQPQPLPTAIHTPAIAHSDASAKTGTANELSFSVSSSDQQKVEVRVMDRGGEVRVSVRAPNEELASTLRSDLGSLTGKLNQSGYTTEAFAPASHSGEFSRDQNNSPANQQQGGGQDRSFNRQGQQQNSQQDGNSGRPQWLDELENSMASTSVRKEGN